MYPLEPTIQISVGDAPHMPVSVSVVVPDSMRSHGPSPRERRIVPFCRGVRRALSIVPGAKQRHVEQPTRAIRHCRTPGAFAVTVSCTIELADPDVAVMRALPGAIARTRPAPSTVATVIASLRHWSGAFSTIAPTLSRASTDSSSSWPAWRNAVAGTTLTLATRLSGGRTTFHGVAFVATGRNESATQHQRAQESMRATTADEAAEAEGPDEARLLFQSRSEFRNR